MTALDQIPAAAPLRPATIKIHVNDAPDAFDVLDLHALRYWLPILGPSASLLLQLLVVDSHVEWTREEMADQLGIRRDKLCATIDRLERFRCVAFAGTDVLIVRRYLPAMSAAQLDRLPAWIRTGAESAIRAAQCTDRVRQMGGAS